MAEHDPAIFRHSLCRSCRGELREVLDLGDIRLNDFPAGPHDHLKVKAVPLRLAVCQRCTLAQLTHTTPPDWLYRTYWYRSSINEMMRDELADVVHDALQRSRAKVRTGALLRVLDIGANDGTLLSSYPVSVYTTGIDPATNLQRELSDRATEAVCGYFPQDARPWRAFDVITAIACCYDLEDPVAFFQRAADLLAPEGMLCVQFQDLLQQMSSRAFDNICHEHLEYYTLHSLSQVAGQAGLRVVDVHPRAINGGSLRVWLTDARRNYHDEAAWNRVQEQFAIERGAGLILYTADRPRLSDPFIAFRHNIGEALQQMHAVVSQARDQGKVIDVYGASTKGNILLQCLGYGPEVIRQAIDRAPQKDGHYTITGIPIVGEALAKVAPADLWLTPIWQFKPSVLERERWYLEQGGVILFPLPRVELVQQ